MPLPYLPVWCLQKFTFDDDTELILLHCDGKHGTHMGGRGHLVKLFEKVRDKFLLNIPSETWSRQLKPTVKTLREKFRALLCTRPTVDCSNTAASGIAEDLTEVDHLSNDSIKEKEIEEDKKRKEKDEENAAGALLVWQRKDMLQNTVSRTRKDSEDDMKEIRAERKRTRGMMEEEEE